MSMQRRSFSSALLASGALLLALAPQAARAYGPEGLFGGRGQPDGSLIMYNVTELPQERTEQTQTILNAPRPGYDSVPVQLGSFELYPLLELDTTYNSNVYASRSLHREDMIGTVRPVMNVYSNWNKHAVALTGFGDVNYHSQRFDENLS